MNIRRPSPNLLISTRNFSRKIIAKPQRAPRTQRKQITSLRTLCPPWLIFLFGKSCFHAVTASWNLFRQDRQDLQDLPLKSYPVDPVNPVKGHDLLDISDAIAIMRQNPRPPITPPRMCGQNPHPLRASLVQSFDSENDKNIKICCKWVFIICIPCHGAPDQENGQHHPQFWM